MWSLLLRKATLCVLYVLLIYCDIIVLSQRLRIYDTFETNRIASNYRSHSADNSSDALLPKQNATTKVPQIHRTKASEDTHYIHGLTREEHKKLTAASEPYAQYRRYRYNAASAPSWRMPRTTTEEAETTTLAEVPHSYFKTTQKPADPDNYWPDRYGSRSYAKPTIRVETTVNTTFGQARIETGLRPRNVCCQNETETDLDSKGKFRFYNSFSRDRGYAPYRAVELVASTSTTSQRPSYKWSDRFSASQSSDSLHEKASNLGLSSSRRVVGAHNDDTDWMTTKRPYRYYTTTWVPRTTKEHIENTARNSLWNSPRHTALDVEPYNPARSGFDGVRGIRPWEDRPISTSTSTRRPATVGGTNVDDYDYYDELDKRQTTSTTKNPWTALPRRTSERSTTPRSSATVSRLNAYDRWSVAATTTSTTRSPYIEYPPGPIYKSYDEDDDFKEWKSNVERKVQKIRRPSGKTKTPGSRMRVTGSPSLENDLVPLFKVSGIEEEDWKFVHETNELEDNFEPAVKHGHGRYRSEWSSDLGSDWKTGRYDSNPLGRRTTRTLATSEPPPTTVRTTQPPTTPTTSSPTVFVPPTRRFVPRKPSVIRRRTTPRSLSGPKYSFRLYTPSEEPSHSSPRSENVSETEGLIERGFRGNSTRIAGVHAGKITLSHTLPTAATATPSATTTTAADTTTVTTTTTTPFTTRTTSTPSTTFYSIASMTTPHMTRMTSPPRTRFYSIASTTTPDTTRTTSTTPYPWPPSTTTAATTAASTSPPVTVHWLTTRKPVFGEGMSIEEQLAEAMRRLHERQKAKELEKQTENRNRIDGSGDWEDQMVNDSPVIIEAVPELADLNLRNDLTVEHKVRERILEDVENAEIFGELIDDHVMQVHDPDKSLKPTGKAGRGLRS